MTPTEAALRDALEPCPFCGSDTVQTSEVRWNPVMTKWAVACVHGCDMRGPPTDDEAGAIAAWNAALSPSSGEPASVAGEVEQAFVRLCEEIGIPATAGAYLEYRNRAALSKPTPVEAGLREALLDHYPAGLWKQPQGDWAGTCRCGHTFFGRVSGEAKSEWADHVLAALSETLPVEREA